MIIFKKNTYVLYVFKQKSFRELWNWKLNHNSPALQRTVLQYVALYSTTTTNLPRPVNKAVLVTPLHFC